MPTALFAPLPEPAISSPARNPGPRRPSPSSPTRIAVDTDGSIYVADEFNDRIRKLTLSVPSALQVTQGAGATGQPGDKITIQVKVTDVSGLAVAGVAVRFAVSSGIGGAVVGFHQHVDRRHRAGAGDIGSTLGPVVITATTDGVAPVTITLQVVTPSPRLDDAQVVGAALSVPAIRAMSAGGIMSAFGKNFGVGSNFRKVGTGDLVGGNVPTVFAGICVDISGHQGAGIGASDTQVNFQVPALSPGNAQVTIITDCGTANQKSSNALTVPVQTAAPEFFYFVTSTNGKNPWRNR